MGERLEIKITITKFNEQGFVSAVGTEKLPIDQWRREPSRGAWIESVIKSLMNAVKDDFNEGPDLVRPQIQPGSERQ